LQRSEDRTREFNDILIDSIDESITALLSREVVDALYAHLQSVHSISKDEIPCKLDTLMSALERTFGLHGSQTIGKAIARRFYSKLKLGFTDSPSRTLLEYVEEAKAQVQSSASKQAEI
jgi:hypothetical protein